MRNEAFGLEYGSASIGGLASSPILTDRRNESCGRVPSRSKCAIPLLIKENLWWRFQSFSSLASWADMDPGATAEGRMPSIACGSIWGG